MSDYDNDKDDDDDDDDDDDNAGVQSGKKVEVEICFNLT